MLGVAAAALLLMVAPRDTVYRGAWALAVLILGAVLSAKLVDAAPMSRGRLAADLQRMRLPFFTMTGERQSGHSWCRPYCARVVRTYRAPDAGPTATLASVAVALEQRRLLTNSHRAVERVKDGVLRSQVRHVDITVAVRRVPPVTAPSGAVVSAGAQIVTIELRARR